MLCAVYQYGMNPINIGVTLVIAQLVQYPQAYKHAAGQSDNQTGQIDSRVSLMFHDISKGDLHKTL
jgi:hypothetical protein